MTERMNMLRIAAPEKSGPKPFDFDPERDIVPLERKRIGERLQSLFDEEKWPDLAGLAADVKVIGTHDALVSKLSTNAWEHIIVSATKSIGGPDWQNELRFAQAMKILRPQSKIINSNERDWLLITRKNTSVNAIAGGEASPHWDSFASILAGMRILFAGFPLTVSDEEWGQMQKRVEWLHSGQEWPRALALAADMRLADHERPSPIGKLQWPPAAKILNDSSDFNRWDIFCRNAAVLKILAAKEVRVSENGLELMTPEPGSRAGGEAPPLPEQLNV